jgi:iron complex transport system permease protein
MKRTAFLAAAAAALVVAAVAGVTQGTAPIGTLDALRAIGRHLAPFLAPTDGGTSSTDVIVWLIRVPRVLIAALVGAGLSVAGAILQGLFRNPLAEPSIVGVGSGAVLGAVIAFISGLTASTALALPLAAFVGAFVALAAVYALATRGGATPVTTLLLSGVAVSAWFGALSSLLISLNAANWQVAQEILFWTMGGLDGRTWTHVWISAPFILLTLVWSAFYCRDLDLMSQGEDTAAALGVEVESTKKALVVLAALATGVSVSVAGAIGFVGLIVPHIARIFVGPSHRRLLPASALAGAAFLVICDLIARTARPMLGLGPVEVRLGIVTAAFGAPFFLHLLMRHKRNAGNLT